MDFNASKILRGVTIAGAMSLSVGSQAASISGYAIGSFNSITNLAGDIITPATASGAEAFSITNADDGGVSTVTWGTPQKKSDWKDNSFIFNGNASDTYGLGEYGSTTLGNLFSLGSFDYYNAMTSQDKISALNFRVDMSIDGFNQMTTGMLGSAYLEFTMSINNTSDNSDPVASADSVWVSAVNVGMTHPDYGPVLMPYDFMNGMDMLIGGDMYNFMLMGFSRDGGATFEQQAISQENTGTTAEIYALISPLAASPVPVPAAVWLFGSGLIALAGLGRRKK
ncbi:MAG: VPLPA-CTERM sorting domain-containing protein [Gammaproteobacteria bacterium]|nr:VPLPA-CTERM sorting domain-containing protein [Gammaproteobacteria bacterium]MDH5593289.1 VPLPA-CTERM sorting domain-containing protein [Gammaproteobacteria bacterium]MDH5614519.1 VPLPA-CTERM sorting domain-containing protein [Gammaproteobacteria bacterium]